jgi:hypothetical protein
LRASDHPDVHQLDCVNYEHFRRNLQNRHADSRFLWQIVPKLFTDFGLWGAGDGQMMPGQRRCDNL